MRPAGEIEGSESSEPLAWERQPGEPPRAYQAFTIYRDLGAGRSIEAVWLALQQQTGTEGGKPPAKRGRAAKEPQEGGKKAARRPDGRFSKWSKAWEWVERAAEWDAELDRQEREISKEARRQMAGIQAERAARLASILADPIIAELERRLQTNPAMLKRLGIEKLIKLAGLVARSLPQLQVAERLARIGGDGKVTIPRENGSGNGLGLRHTDEKGHSTGWVDQYGNPVEVNFGWTSELDETDGGAVS